MINLAMLQLLATPMFKSPWGAYDTYDWAQKACLRSDVPWSAWVLLCSYTGRNVE